MTILILKGKSHKGKNRIRELGDRWILIRKGPNPKDRVPSFFIGQENDPIRHCRWIAVQDDPDFTIEKILDNEVAK